MFGGGIGLIFRKKIAMSALKTLILINNDRKMHLRQISSFLHESDIKFYIENQIHQSEEFHRHLINLAEEFKFPEFNQYETTLSGKLYHLWIAIKSAITKMNIDGILANCIFCEQASVKAYNEISVAYKSVNKSLLKIVEVQLQKVNESINKLEFIRDNLSATK